MMVQIALWTAYRVNGLGNTTKRRSHEDNYIYYCQFIWNFMWCNGMDSLRTSTNNCSRNGCSTADNSISANGSTDFLPVGSICRKSADHY